MESLGLVFGVGALWLWACGVVSVLVLPFDVGLWAWVGGCVLLLCPLVSLGGRGVVQACGGVGMALRELGGWNAGLDVASGVLAVRGLWSLGNWC